MASAEFKQCNLFFNFNAYFWTEEDIELLKNNIELTLMGMEENGDRTLDVDIDIDVEYHEQSSDLSVQCSYCAMLTPQEYEVLANAVKNSVALFE